MLIKTLVFGVIVCVSFPSTTCCYTEVLLSHTKINEYNEYTKVTARLIIVKVVLLLMAAGQSCKVNAKVFPGLFC